MNSFDLLGELCDIPGVSGDEGNVRNFILGYLRGLNPVVDPLGNIYLYYPSNKVDAKTILMSAHLDEIGYVIKSIDKSTGRIYLQKLGGFESKTAIGEEVIINGNVTGIITTEKINNLNSGDKEIYVDTGYSFDSLHELNVEIGSFVSFARKTKILNSGVIVGKALDDRIGCYLLLELINSLQTGKVINSSNLLFIFSTREELLQQGVLNYSKHWTIDSIIVLDTINAHEYTTPNNHNPRSIGSGPVIYVYNQDGITHSGLNAFIQKIAKDHNIPIQLGIQPRIATDILRLKYSVPDTVLAVTIRNGHTGFSVASLKDIVELHKLICFIVSY